MSVVVIENNNVEKGIRKLKKESSQHLAEIKWRYLHPKQSERRKAKMRRAERKRIRREVYQQSGKQRYLAWRKRKAKQQSA